MSKLTMYQTGTINSLMDAVYYGDTTIAELKQHGDFGLGTFDLVDGEMIVCDNHYYRADADGHLSIVDDNVKSPFAVINPFVADVRIELRTHDYESLTTWLEQQFVSKNLIYALKITGQFENVHLRSETCQLRPFQKLSETLPKLQHAFVEKHTEGIMVGCWFPSYLRQVNVPGFHFHFIDNQRRIGGHVFDFDLTQGFVELQTLKRLQLDLIDNDEFFNANLDADTTDVMAKVERER